MLTTSIFVLLFVSSILLVTPSPILAAVINWNCADGEQRTKSGVTSNGLDLYGSCPDGNFHLKDSTLTDWLRISASNIRKLRVSNVAFNINPASRDSSIIFSQTPDGETTYIEELLVENCTSNGSPIVLRFSDNVNVSRTLTVQNVRAESSGGPSGLGYVVRAYNDVTVGSSINITNNTLEGTDVRYGSAFAFSGRLYTPAMEISYNSFSWAGKKTAANSMSAAIFSAAFSSVEHSVEELKITDNAMTVTGDHVSDSSNIVRLANIRGNFTTMLLIARNKVTTDTPGYFSNMMGFGAWAPSETQRAAGVAVLLHAQLLDNAFRLTHGEGAEFLLWAPQMEGVWLEGRGNDMTFNASATIDTEYVALVTCPENVTDSRFELTGNILRHATVNHRDCNIRLGVWFEKMAQNVTVTVSHNVFENIELVKNVAAVVALVSTYYEAGKHAHNSRWTVDNNTVSILMAQPNSGLSGALATTKVAVLVRLITASFSISAENTHVGARLSVTRNRLSVSKKAGALGAVDRPVAIRAVYLTDAPTDIVAPTAGRSGSDDSVITVSENELRVLDVTTANTTVLGFGFGVTGIYRAVVNKNKVWCGVAGVEGNLRQQVTSGVECRGLSALSAWSTTTATVIDSLTLEGNELYSGCSNFGSARNAEDAYLQRTQVLRVDNVTVEGSVHLTGNRIVNTGCAGCDGARFSFAVVAADEGTSSVTTSATTPVAPAELATVINASIPTITITGSSFISNRCFPSCDVVAFSPWWGDSNVEGTNNNKDSNITIQLSHSSPSVSVRNNNLTIVEGDMISNRYNAASFLSLVSLLPVADSSLAQHNISVIFSRSDPNPGGEVPLLSFHENNIQCQKQQNGFSQYSSGDGLGQCEVACEGECVVASINIAVARLPTSAMARSFGDTALQLSATGVARFFKANLAPSLARFPLGIFPSSSSSSSSSSSVMLPMNVKGMRLKMDCNIFPSLRQVRRDAVAAFIGGGGSPQQLTERCLTRTATVVSTTSTTAEETTSSTASTTTTSTIRTANTTSASSSTLPPPTTTSSTTTTGNSTAPPSTSSSSSSTVTTTTASTESTSANSGGSSTTLLSDATTSTTTTATTDNVSGNETNTTTSTQTRPPPEPPETDPPRTQTMTLPPTAPPLPPAVNQKVATGSTAATTISAALAFEPSAPMVASRTLGLAVIAENCKNGVIDTSQVRRAEPLPFPQSMLPSLYIGLSKDVDGWRGYLRGAILANCLIAPFAVSVMAVAAMAVLDKWQKGRAKEAARKAGRMYVNQKTDLYAKSRAFAVFGLVMGVGVEGATAAAASLVSVKRPLASFKHDDDILWCFFLGVVPVLIFLYMGISRVRMMVAKASCDPASMRWGSALEEVKKEVSEKQWLFLRLLFGEQVWFLSIKPEDIKTKEFLTPHEKAKLKEKEKERQRAKKEAAAKAKKSGVGTATSAADDAKEEKEKEEEESKEEAEERKNREQKALILKLWPRLLPLFGRFKGPCTNLTITGAAGAGAVTAAAGAGDPGDNGLLSDVDYMSLQEMTRLRSATGSGGGVKGALMKARAVIATYTFFVDFFLNIAMGLVRGLVLAEYIPCGSGTALTCLIVMIAAAYSIVVLPRISHMSCALDVFISVLLAIAGIMTAAESEATAGFATGVVTVLAVLALSTSATRVIIARKKKVVLVPHHQIDAVDGTASQAARAAGAGGGANADPMGGAEDIPLFLFDNIINLDGGTVDYSERQETVRNRRMSLVHGSRPQGFAAAPSAVAVGGGNDDDNDEIELDIDLDAEFAALEEGGQEMHDQSSAAGAAAAASGADDLEVNLDEDFGAMGVGAATNEELERNRRGLERALADDGEMPEEYDDL